MYTYLTYLQVRQALAQRLGDVSNTFWLDAELKLYVLEALRTWNAYATYWRDRGTFNTAAATPFYDVTVQMSSILGMTVTDRALITDLQYALMEATSNGSTWPGTDQFTFTAVQNAIQRRRDQFLLETAAVLTHSNINVPPTPIGRVPLSDTILEVRRAAWISLDSNGNPSTAYPLVRADELQFDYGASTWDTDPDTPSWYSTIVAPPLTVQLSPVPLDKGTLDLLTINAGADLDPATAATVLGIPDDFAWVVKYGALADLLGQDGQARDPDRATYCESRWTEGLELARISPSVILASLQGINNLMDDLWSLDRAIPDWQSASSVPSVIATAGRNILAVGIMPDAGPYSITCDVVRNAPIPVNDSDSIQLGRSEVDVVLDYAEHLAAFKMGGAEWKATNRAAVNMTRAAAQYNDRLNASALFKNILWPSVYRYRRDVPERQSEGVAQ